MEKFVRSVSVWILWLYTAEGVFFAGVSVWGVINGVLGMPNVGGGTIDGEPTLILDGIGRFLFFIGIVVLASVIFIAAGEIFLLRRNFRKAIENDSFKDYGAMSTIALISGAVNFIYSLIMSGIIFCINIFVPGLIFDEEILKFLAGFPAGIFIINIILVILSAVNLSFSKKFAQNGSEPWG